MAFTKHYLPAYILWLVGTIYFAYQVFDSIWALPLEWQRFIIAILCFKILIILVRVISVVEVRHLQRQRQEQYLSALDAEIAKLDAEEAKAEVDDDKTIH